MLGCNYEAPRLKNISYKPRTTVTRRVNLKFFVAQIQIPFPNKYLDTTAFFVGIMVDGQRTHSTHIGSDNSAENTPNAPKIFGPKDQKFRIFEKKTLSECP